MRIFRHSAGLFRVCAVIALAALFISHRLSAKQLAPLPGETLIWDEEFAPHGNQSQPDPSGWTYDTGNGGSGGLQTYCAWGEEKPPCDSSQPNAFVGGDGYLHIVSRQPTPGVYTSARLKTQNLRSFQYGRIEARIQLPAGQGMWPAFWMLGENIPRVSWPACGEIDIMENLGREPRINHSTIHGPGYQRAGLGTTTELPAGQRLSDSFHIYGMIWEPGSIAFYFDNPSRIVARYTRSNLPAGAKWPFDDGRFFFILNTAVGGAWGGSPDTTSRFPQSMLVDYVRVWRLS
jgi:beta-glucanase (GH16 family)